MTGIENITGSAQTSATESEKTKIIGKDEFFKMLIVQLKNQDPLNPLEGTAFAAQLAQFASLEQLTNLNTALASQNANYAMLVNAQSINLIGKEITAQTAAGADGTPGTVITGKVTAVNFKNQTALLTVNGQDIPFTALLSVR